MDDKLESVRYLELRVQGGNSFASVHSCPQNGPTSLQPYSRVTFTEVW
jgi:hypothetical protein